MKLPRRRFLHLAAGAAALPAVSRVAWAQTYPSQPITMMVPFPAGGPTDTIGRTVAEGMRASLRQPIIIENVTGVFCTRAGRRAANGCPDRSGLRAWRWQQVYLALCSPDRLSVWHSHRPAAEVADTAVAKAVSGRHT